MLTLQYAPSVSCYGSTAQQVDPAEQENIAQVESTPESANVGYCDYTQLEAMQNCASDLVPGSESNQKRALSRNSDNDNNNNNNNNTSPYDYYGHESGYGVPHYAGQNQYPMEASEYGVGLHTLNTPDPSHHQSSLNNNNNQQTHYYEMSATIGPGTIQQRTFPVIYDPTHLNNQTSNPYGTRSTPSEPFLHIVEQPTNRIRYRYRSEKGSHGGLNGENSCHMKKTYPTVKLENYSPQSAPVYIRVSLATNEEHPKLHVHKLMGRHCSEDGACTLPVNENLIGVFQNLGILFIGKKEVPEILFRRKLTDFQLRSNPTQQQQPLATAISDKMQHKLRQESEREAKDMNLNSVRICFEAFQLQNDALYSICSPVYSRPIANQKSPDSGELKIIRINRYCGSVRGGDEVYILCEKVNKKEIRVRFFEIDQEGNQQWESFGSFSESDVHHQVAIVFRTPPYRNQNLLKPVRVFLQLYRQRDGEFSEPRTFIYKPKLNGGCGGVSNDNGYSNGNDELTDILGSKSGLQESVLSQIKLENQPPGYKRKKFIHNQSAKNSQTTKASSQSINSTGENNSSTTTTSSGHRNQQQTNNNHNNSRNSSRTSSTISTRKSNISDKLTIKTESTSSSISEITTNNSKVRPASCVKLSSMTTRTTTKAAVAATVAQNQPQISNANSSGQMEVNFCQGTDVKIQPESCTIQFSANGKRSRESRSALSSTNSPSASPSATSPTSPLMTGPSGATGDSSSVPLQSFNQLIHSNHHQFQQQSQHLLANNQSAVGPIDFDHLDSMWQSAPPPMSAEVVNQHHSNLFQNFLSMQNSTPTNSQLPGFCSTPQMQSHHHQQQQQQSSQNQQSFVEVLLNHHQDQMANGSAQHLHSHLHPLHHGHHIPSNLGMLDQQHQSIISLDLAPGHHGTSSSSSSASSLISHSPSMMSSGSPSSVSSCSGTEHHHLSSSSSASSPQQSSNFQFNPNIGTLQCMLYS